MLDEFNKATIGFALTPDGAARLHQITEANVGKQLAILLDDQAMSAQTIQGPIGGAGRISGNSTQQEAADLARFLRAGEIPASLRLLTETKFLAEAGDSKLREAVWGVALILGLGADLLMFWPKR